MFFACCPPCRCSLCKLFLFLYFTVVRTNGIQCMYTVVQTTSCSQQHTSPPHKQVYGLEDWAETHAKGVTIPQELEGAAADDEIERTVRAKVAVVSPEDGSRQVCWGVLGCVRVSLCCCCCSWYVNSPRQQTYQCPFPTTTTTTRHYPPHSRNPSTLTHPKQASLGQFYRESSQQLGGAALVGQRVCVDWGRHNTGEPDRCVRLFVCQGQGAMWWFTSE